jgi:hypothetical protein
VEEALAAGPSPSGGWIHQLDDAAMATPGDHEVGHPSGQSHDAEGRKGLRFGQEHVVHRQHHLLRLEAELHGHLLQRVDGSAVNVGLAGFAQASVTHSDTKTL